jgi:hypothetical protein
VPDHQQFGRIHLTADEDRRPVPLLQGRRIRSYRISSPAVPEPRPVIPLEYADHTADRAERRRRVWLRVGRICSFGAWMWALAAWAVVFRIKVESVLFTGPVLCVLGLAIVLAGVLAHQTLFLALGAAHCALCVLFAVLVNVNHWGPGAAHRPFVLLGALYLLAAVVPTHLASRERPADSGAPG